MVIHPDEFFSDLPTSRKGAKLLDSKHYFTGKACCHGHVAPRLTSTGRCKECNHIGLVAWREANPDRQRITYEAYYAANRDMYSARHDAWSEANPEKRKAINAAYRSRNPEKYRAWKAASRARDPEKARAGVRAWIAKNPEKVRVLKRNRKALKRSAEGTHTAADIRRIFKMQEGKCAGCSKDLGNDSDNRHVDHIQPISKGGSNGPKNLQILCQTCNLRKGAKDPNTFNRECFGRLL